MAQQKKRGPGRPAGSKNKTKSSQTKTAPKTKQEKIQDIQMMYDKDKRQIDVIWSITLMALGVFFIFTVIADTTGAFGEKIHDICLGLFGFMAYILPFLFLIAGGLLIAKKLQHIGGRTAIFSVLIYIMMCMLNSYRFIDENNLAYGFSDIAKYYKLGVQGEQGGAIGMELGSLIVKGFGKPGLLIFSIAVMIISIFLVANTPISEFFGNWKRKREAKKLENEIEDDVTNPYKGNRDTGIAPPMGRKIYGGRAVDMQDTLVEKKGLEFDSPSGSGNFDSESMGIGTVSSSKAKTGYGLDGGA